MSNDTTCAIEGCERSAHARGLCNTHYVAARRTGDLPPRPTAQDRFWRYVEKTDECWIWTGSAKRTGYGEFWWDNRVGYAHRFAYEAAHGPIPEGLTLDHVCRTPLCVRPDHLEAVSQMENNRRAVFDATERGQVTETCIRGHLKTPENVYRHGTRYHCRACRRDEARERYRRKRDAARESA